MNTILLTIALASSSFMSQAITSGQAPEKESAQQQSAGLTMLKHTPLRNAGADESDATPIYEAPDGDKKLYSRDAWGFSGYGSRFFFNYTEIQPTHVVFCDNGDAYIYNPFSRKNTSTYIVGKVDGDKIRVPLPQPIFQEADWQNPDNMLTYYIRTVNVEVDENGYITSSLADDTEVTFSISDGKISLDLSYEPQPNEEGISPYPSKVLAYTTSDGIWANYGDCWQDYKPFNGKLTEAPANLSTRQWAMTWGEDGRFVNVGFDGDDVYIQGYEPSFPEAWIKGKRDGDNFVFPSNQYLGELTDYHYIMFFGAIANEAEDMLYLTDDITFSYDEQSRVMSCRPDGAIVSNAAEDKIFWYAYYESPRFCLQPDDMSQVPPVPRFWGYSDYLVDYGYANFSFYLDFTTDEGYILNTDNMYYEVEFDGLVETFTPEDYYMTEEISMVPYNFSEGSITSQGAYHNLTFYSIGLESLGVRQYNIHDGQTYVSPTMTYYIQSGDIVTGIEDVSAPRELTDVRWFSLSGNEVAAPGNGLFIRVSTYADGTKESHKVMLR